jgi:hypothetical protein
MPVVSPQLHPPKISSGPQEVVMPATARMSGSTSMLEGLYGAEKRHDLPPKRKRVEAIVIDDDEDDEDQGKKRSVARHKGAGIIGEYMKEGKKLAPSSDSLPVDLTKGM